MITFILLFELYILVIKRRIYHFYITFDSAYLYMQTTPCNTAGQSYVIMSNSLAHG